MIISVTCSELGIDSGKDIGNAYSYSLKKKFWNWVLSQLFILRLIKNVYVKRHVRNLHKPSSCEVVYQEENLFSHSCRVILNTTLVNIKRILAHFLLTMKTVAMNVSIDYITI